MVRLGPFILKVLHGSTFSTFLPHISSFLPMPGDNSPGLSAGHNRGNSAISSIQTPSGNPTCPESDTSPRNESLGTDSPDQSTTCMSKELEDE